MSGFVGRLGTKINYATGKTEKTEFDEQTRLIIARNDHFREDLEQLKARLNDSILQGNNLSKQERIAESLSQMSARVAACNLKEDAPALAEALRGIGKCERELATKTLQESITPMQTILKSDSSEFKKAKNELDKARVEMDGCRSKRQRSTSPDPNVQAKLEQNEADAVAAYEQKIKEVHEIGSRINDDMDVVKTALQNFANQLLKFHEECADKLKEYTGS